MASGNQIGTAYIKIMPTMDGMKKNLLSGLNSEAGNAGKESGENMGSNLMASLKSSVVKLAATIGIGKIIMQSFNLGADLEQQIGGIETLFNESADKMREYANQAYKTAGVSANEYMSQATSFAASLKQTLSDADAAEYANRAIVDMSDNANKMGTSIENIQNAYQGFAKQNYTMLDNLKLGYGGTKTEMERLISDASKMTDVQSKLNLTVEDGDLSFSNIVNAISVMQESMGIAGTTAKESASTFSGSFDSMKSAAQNFLAAFMMNGKDGVDVTSALTSLIESVNTFVFGNAIPAIGRMVTSIIQIIPQLITESIPMIIQSVADLIANIVTGIQTAGPTLEAGFQGFIANLQTFLTEQLPTFLQNGIDWITNILTGVNNALPGLLEGFASMVASLLSMLIENLPQFLQNGIDIVLKIREGFGDTVSTLLEAFYTMIEDLLDYLIDNMPQFLKNGVELVTQLASGIAKNLPKILATTAEMLAKIISKIAEHFPKILTKGVELLGKLAAGIVQAIPDLLSKIPGILLQLAESFMDYDWLGLGANILGGIANGIADAVTGLVDIAIKACGKLVDSVKSFFGIASPSKLFRDEIGEFIPAGISVGIEGNMGSVKDAMDDMNNTIYDSALHEINGSLPVSVSSTVSSVNKQAQNAQAGSSGYVTNYGGITINIEAKDGQFAKQIAKEVEKILKSNSEIEDRGRLQSI